MWTLGGQKMLAEEGSLLAFLYFKAAPSFRLTKWGSTGTSPFLFVSTGPISLGVGESSACPTSAKVTQVLLATRVDTVTSAQLTCATCFGDGPRGPCMLDGLR